jgi:hypothetical protein
MRGEPQDRPGDDSDQIQFGSARPPRWALSRWASSHWEWTRRPRSRWLAGGATVLIVAAVAVIVAVTVPSHTSRGGESPVAGRGAGAAPAASRGHWYDVPGPVAVKELGHPLLADGSDGSLLAVGGGWEPGAAGAVLVRVQLAAGVVTVTKLPPLNSNGPATILELPGETMIRPWDIVPGYVVPNGHAARGLPAGVGEGDYTFPGPDAGQLWIGEDRGTTPFLRLVTVTGGAAGQTIRLPANGGYPAVPDGQGYVLVQKPDGVYDARPDGLHKVAAGMLVAAGREAWLVSNCPQAGRCVNTVVDPATGTRHVLPATDDPSEVEMPFWPPGTACSDGTTAALLGPGPGRDVTLRLLDLRTGAHRDILIGPVLSSGSLVWSPGSRWLFTLTAGGAIEAVDARTGHVQGLGVALPPVSYLASGSPG